MAREYSDEDRATALAALDANGGNASKTARETGVARSTLKGWRDGKDERVAELRHQKKGELADELEALAHKIVGVMPGKLEDANLQQLATSLGIIVDKMQVLRGDSTGNSTLKIQVVYTDANANPLAA